MPRRSRASTPLPCWGEGHLAEGREGEGTAGIEHPRQEILPGTRGGPPQPPIPNPEPSYRR